MPSKFVLAPIEETNFIIQCDYKHANQTTFYSFTNEPDLTFFQNRTAIFKVKPKLNMNIEKDIENAAKSITILHSSFSRLSGATCHYIYDGKQYTFIADEKQFLNALEDSKIIDSWNYSSGSDQSYVTYTYKNDDGVSCLTAEPLLKFIESWGTKQWLRMILTHELLKKLRIQN